MRRQLPLILCFVSGLVMIVQFFVPHPPFNTIYDKVSLEWWRIVGMFALVLAVGNLINTHYFRIKRKGENWPYSIAVFVGLIGMTAVGLINGFNGSKFQWLFYNIQVPMDAAMFSILAFFVASASYRAFRARTFEATLLLVAAILVMLGNMPVGIMIWSKISSSTPLLPKQMKDWIMEVPNLASQRGIILGLSLGAISQSLRIILGIERSYLGGGD